MSCKIINRLQILLVIICCTCSYVCVAQHGATCGHVQHQKYLENKYKGFQESVRKLEYKIAKKKLLRASAKSEGSASYVIPVVFHIVYKSSSQNIPENRILDQLRVINEDYQKLNKDTINIPAEFTSVAANVNIQFCLATRDPLGRVTNGINRKATNRSEFDMDFDDENLKRLSYWPSDQYLNVWVANLSNKILGYAQFPSGSSITDLNYNVPASLDGVVVNYQTVGFNQNSSYYNKGRTLTHEIGHWLGLIHNWGDNFCGNDYVDDTPVQDSSNGSMKPNNCVDHSYCTGTQQLDMSNNFMDYSPDVCMNMFTLGQRQRMHSAIASAPRRQMLQSSLGCFQPIVVLPFPYNINFNNGAIPPNDTIGNANSSLKWELKQSINNDFYITSANVNATSSGSNSLQYITPYIDFTGVTKPILEIDLAVQANSIGTIDSIVISFSPNEKLFFKLKILSGAALSALATNSLFPDSSWQTVKINLAQLAGTYIASIKIVIYSKGNAGVSIDNIRFYDNQNKHEIRLYPIPAREKITAMILQDEFNSMNFEIINCLGKVIRTWSVNKTKLKEEIPTPELSAGMYFVRTTFIESNEVRVEKFTIE